MINIIIITAIFVLLKPVQGMTAPLISEVSGSLVNGTDIVIRGQQFGSKTNDHPLVYDDFDTSDSGRSNGDTIAGDLCSDYGQWSSEITNTPPVYTSSMNRRGSTLASYSYFQAVQYKNHSPLFIDYSASHQNTLLIDFWTRAHISGGDDWWQIKYWRIGDGQETDGHAHFQNGRLIIANGGKAFYELFFNDLSNPTWPSSTGMPITIDYFKQAKWDEWQHYTVFLKASSGAGEKNGSASIYIDDLEITTDADHAMETYKSGDIWKRATFGWYLGNDESGTATAELWFDNIYIDNAWNSVWLGDASSWDKCTHREIQVVKSWSSTEITFSYNQGSFKDDAQVYVYIMDGDGSVNTSGYSARVGYRIIKAPHLSLP